MDWMAMAQSRIQPQDCLNSDTDLPFPQYQGNSLPDEQLSIVKGKLYTMKFVSLLFNNWLVGYLAVR
jgi:hypothetical protein